MPLARPAPETQAIQALRGLLEVLVLLALLVLPAALVLLVPQVRRVALELPVLLVVPVSVGVAALRAVTRMEVPDAPAIQARATSPTPIPVILRKASRVEADRNEV